MKVYVRASNTAEERDMNFQAAMKIFKRRVSDSGVLLETRKREFYEKPGVKRRHKHEAALKTQKKKRR